MYRLIYLSQTRFADNADNIYLRLIVRCFNVFYTCSFVNFTINITQIKIYIDLKKYI